MLAEAIDRRVQAELRSELEQIADELLERAGADAPTLPPPEHVERHPGQPPLADSGYKRITELPGLTAVEVGFTAFYAKWQHERRDYRHDDGKAGYLSDNLKALFPGYRERLEAAFWRGLRAGIDEAIRGR